VAQEKNKPQTTSSNASKPKTVRRKKYSSQQELNQTAIKYKAFQHTFSPKDMSQGLNKKKITKRLKETKHLEESYLTYLRELKKDPTKKVPFPWDSPVRRFIFFLSFWTPRVLKMGMYGLIGLVIINYIPGPTQHIIEFLMARTVYDAARIRRVPASLDTYAHSANIVDNSGGIIKSYGKREVTAEIPDKVKRSLLACEDHYLLPHPEHPWYVNGFLIHAGVSWINLVGAVKDTIAGHPRGASTIIMQNAKKILGNDQRTITNKLEEIVISYVLVSKFGKDKNLDFYINTVPVGSNIYGFPAAASNYFKKDLNKLNYQQLVTIASFIPNHNRQRAFYQIVQGKDFTDLPDSLRNHARQSINKVNLGLKYLKDIKEITEEQYALWHLDTEDSIRRIGLRDFRSPLYGQEEWTSWNVIREVCSRSYTVEGQQITGPELLLDLQGDVVVETGVNIALVEEIKQIIDRFLNSSKYQKILAKRNRHLWKKDLARYKKNHQKAPYTDFDGYMRYLKQNLNVGVIAVNPKGEVIAYVGGKEFFSSAPGNTDKHIIIDLMNSHATIIPSSTIKPVIAYFNMIQTGADLQTKYEDKPLEYKYSKTAGRHIWLPRNWYGYDKKGKGANRYLGRKYSLIDAQVQSVNTIFARLYNNRQVRNSMLLAFDKIGMQYNQEDAKYWPFGIGASNLPLQQWLGIYNAFLDGMYKTPAFVKRITVNGKEVYNRDTDPANIAIPFFDSIKEREDEIFTMYEVCNRGTGASMKHTFKHFKNLVSGKTGTAPQGKSSLFISHFNPYSDRTGHKDKTMTMMVTVTTNTGGFKSVGTSTQGPTQIAGAIYEYIFNKELHNMMDEKITAAKKGDNKFGNNHIYWANTNRYMEKLLNGNYKKTPIYKNIIGVDGYSDALQQILNPSNHIYTGRNDLFTQLVEYYCRKEKIVKLED
jgi:membrane peptidoglycan carboxypeptidase